MRKEEKSHHFLAFESNILIISRSTVSYLVYQVSLSLSLSQSDPIGKQW